MPQRKERQQRLERTVAFIHQRWGEDALRRGGTRARTTPHISTGFPALDEALGIGGIPCGRISALYGAPTSGKVTLAALLLARAQAQFRRPVAYIDLLGTCDADYLERCGVRLRDLLVVRPQDDRQALDLTLTLAGQAEVALLLFDHWGAMAGDASTQNFASGMLDHLNGQISKTRTTLLILDELAPWRQRLLPNASRQALSGYAAVRLGFSRERWFYDGPDVRGYRAQVTVQKNKLGPSGQTVPIEIHFNGTVKGKGI